jgi:hypothetical protein
VPLLQSAPAGLSTSASYIAVSSDLSSNSAAR